MPYNTRKQTASIYRTQLLIEYSRKMFPKNVGVSQLVENLTDIQGVGGSSPSINTKMFKALPPRAVWCNWLTQDFCKV